MNQTENVSIKSEKYRKAGPLLDKEHGYFNSATVTLDPEKVYEFCQDKHNIQKVLSDLPTDVDNFLELNLISSDKTDSNEYRVTWENKPGTKLEGNLIFLIKKAPADRGTIISVEASFEKFKINEEGPSNLMNIFLRRMKALMETGEIATIKGQPSGREEISEPQKKTLH